MKEDRQPAGSHGAAGRYYIAATDQASRRILVMDPAVEDWNEEQAVTWSWAPSETNGFGRLMTAWGLPTDAKVYRSERWGGEWMVVTDSLGLAAIVPYPDGDSRQWGLSVGGNPHSVELLPNGNLAVAASTGGWVRVYASSQGPDAETFAEYAFPGAHGLVWHPGSRLLWAVGDHHLVSLSIEGSDSEPLIRETAKVPLPTPYGHDLQPVCGDDDRLWVSTGSRVYQFVFSTGMFLTDFPGSEAASRQDVKTVGSQPSGQIVQTVPQAAGSLYVWTTDTVDFFSRMGREFGRELPFTRRVSSCRSIGKRGGVE
ncbi:DUF6528 family protein [Paenibacillus sp. CC-CFT747]|nr:DUF6528 family protein [Paenibacillus sp. CC-CFT747]